MRTLKLLAAAVSLSAVLAGPAVGQGLLMARSTQMFPEAMTQLQGAIGARGYTVTRLQEVNENLAKMHYQSDMYRVVFFGKYQEVKELSEKHPDLIPYLPLSITIFAEGDQAVLVAAHPLAFAEFFPDPELKVVFERWERDLISIMDEVREAK